ncbi:MAG: ethanolamine ammonia-lyase subunit EutC [Anaerovoracaceae bacterium]|nr:ethanolamine ammonia-lyase subunit EutC [Anaerovoracaceae bacterium]
MDTRELKAIIEDVLNNMDLGTGVGTETCATGSAEAIEAAKNDKAVEAPSPRELKKADDKGTKLNREESEVEDGELVDMSTIDIKEQYLVENPYDKEGFYELKLHAPCRLGIGKAGARYKTLPQLLFRAAHSAAQDAVFSDVDQDFVDGLGLFTVQTKCESKDQYLTRPDLGRRLNEEGAATVKEKCAKNPTVQIFVSDGLSSAAVAANTEDVLSGLMQGLKANGINVGTPFFVKYGRVGVMDEVSEITGADVTCVLIGERPGLITATSMSAYIAYKATIGMPEARRTVVSNIHSSGTIPAEAGAHIAEVIKIMLEKKASGTDLKL